MHRPGKQGPDTALPFMGSKTGKTVETPIWSILCHSMLGHSGIHIRFGHTELFTVAAMDGAGGMGHLCLFICGPCSAFWTRPRSTTT